MKKTLRIIAMVLAILMLTAGAVAEEGGKPSIVAHKANGITIDGNLDDWNLDSPAVVKEMNQIIRDGQLWKGENDCSVTFYLAWDEDNLYIAAEVTEDTPFGAIEMLEIAEQDNLELFLSTDPNADPARTEFGTNDFLIYFSMDEGDWSTAVDRSMLPKEVMKSVRFKTIGMDGGENVLPGYECAAVPTTKGFVWEAVLPWAALSKDNDKQDKKCSLEKYTPAIGDVLAVDFGITDIDYPCPGTEYIPKLAWTGGSMKIMENPSLWGSFTIAE